MTPLQVLRRFADELTGDRENIRFLTHSKGPSVWDNRHTFVHELYAVVGNPQAFDPVKLLHVSHPYRGESLYPCHVYWSKDGDTCLTDSCLLGDLKSLKETDLKDLLSSLYALSEEATQEVFKN